MSGTTWLQTTRGAPNTSTHTKPHSTHMHLKPKHLTLKKLTELSRYACLLSPSQRYSLASSSPDDSIVSPTSYPHRLSDVVNN